MHCFEVPYGCECPSWFRFATADELGLDDPKWTVDFATGETYISYPTKEDGSAEAA